jgi:DNA polymerase-3 subunit delta'
MIRFSNIPDLEELKSRLIRSVALNRMPHAQLFAGSDGSAALPLALALAKYMACDKPLPGDCCDECPSCKQFNHFNYPDLHLTFPFAKTEDLGTDPVCKELRRTFTDFLQQEIFITSNTWQAAIQTGNKQLSIPVKETEDIIHDLSLTSYAQKPRFVIIWQAELMNQSAANKILKILEEPNPFTYFFLIAHQPEKILPTVLSRCVTVKIPLHKDSDILNYLKHRYPDLPDYNTISLSAEGSIGKAVELITQFEEQEQAAEQFVRWMRLIYAAKPEEMVNWSENMSALTREELKTFLLFASKILRQAFLINNNAPVQLAFGKDSFELRKFAPFVNTNRMAEILSIIDTCRKDIERNGNSKVVLLDTSLLLTKYISKT